MYETILIHLKDEKLRGDLLKFSLSLKFINKVSCALLHVTYLLHVINFIKEERIKGLIILN